MRTKTYRFLGLNPMRTKLIRDKAKSKALTNGRRTSRMVRTVDSLIKLNNDKLNDLVGRFKTKRNFYR